MIIYEPPYHGPTCEECGAPLSGNFEVTCKNCGKFDHIALDVDLGTRPSWRPRRYVSLIRRLFTGNTDQYVAQGEKA